ncbi:hypothetical protein IAU60_004963 [Kwoniella sp. DSM 27419]
MTEAGPSRAVFTAPVHPDHSRPSLFDLLAQEQLRELFHPVVRYVLSYFAQRYPRYLLRVLNHHEEFFAFLLLLLERHHLRTHNASVSEHFYGLRTIPSGSIHAPRLDAFEPPKRRKLSRRQQWGLLMFLVGLPYIRARAQDYYERLGGGREDELSIGASAALTPTDRIYKAVYPYASLGLDLVFLGYDIAYLFNRTDHHRPWHRWLGLRVARRGPEDEILESHSLLSRLPPLLPPLLLALKLSQWWYSPASPRAHAALTADRNDIASTHAAIQPPKPLPILPESGLLPASTSQTPSIEKTESTSLSGPNGPADKGPIQAGREYTIGATAYGKCPLCTKKWQNPAILPSGWVVCWRCGWDAVEGEEDEEEHEGEHEAGLGGQDEKAHTTVGAGSPPRNSSMGRRRGRCPITGVAIAPGQLRRVLV